MLNSEIQDILTVLAVGIYADKKVHSSEVQSFTRSVSQVSLSKNDDVTISGAKALLWFEQNRDEISAKFDGPQKEFDAWLIPILERVAQHAKTDELLRLLDDISIADDELHISEVAFIVFVKRIWGAVQAPEAVYSLL
jgi:hypothetical protein